MRRGLALGALVAGLWAASAAGAQPLEPSITLRASTTHPVAGQRVTLTGTVSGAVPGTTVRLYANPYPYRTVSVAGTTTTAADGSFSFNVFPDRVTRYGSVVTGTTAASVVLVYASGHAITRVTDLPLGRAKVVVVLFHPRDLHWSGERVRWWFAPGWHGRFSPAPATRTARLSPYATVLYTTDTLPAGHFRWRACFHAPGAGELTDPQRLAGCTGRGYAGGGSLPTGFPGPAAVARAERYLAGRGGRTALAVVDSEGRLSGVNLNEQFITGSVVKAMLLVAYLRRLDALGQHRVDSYSNSFLYPMINVSDNNAATKCWSIVGDSGLYAVARAAGMTHFAVDTSASWGGSWGAALLTAADQARFFFEMDSLIPSQFVGYANYLLSTIAGYESWGIPAVARPLGYTVYFKAGWRPSPDIFLVHQIARLVGHGHTFSIAVMTDGDADMSYGIDTIQGVTATLLR